MDFPAATAPQESRVVHKRARTMKSALMAALLGLCPSANAQGIVTLEQDLAREIGAVDLHAGLSRAQAGTLAEYYCRRYVGGCGAVAPATDRNADWAVVPFTGVAAIAATHPIMVGKHSGKISWHPGPSLNLLDLIGSKEAAPMPLDRSDAKPGRAAASRVKVQFSVLPDGTVANARFMRSSRNRECDREVWRIVSDWRFPPRGRPIELVTELGCAQ